MTAPEPLAMVDLLRRAAALAERVSNLDVTLAPEAVQAVLWLADWEAMRAQIDGPGARWVLADNPQPMLVCDHARAKCGECQHAEPHARFIDRDFDMCAADDCNFMGETVQCVACDTLAAPFASALAEANVEDAR